MRKQFKLALAGLVVLSMILTPTIALSQDNLSSPIGGDIEIVILDEIIPSEKADFIKAKLSGENTAFEVSPMSILCIFGHSISTTQAMKITHNYYSSSPRCKTDIYSIEYCSRSSCDYYSETFIASEKAACH